METITRGKPFDYIPFKGILGLSGAILAGYEWKWMLKEREHPIEGAVLRRVSDWLESRPNEITGREIVHQFYVIMPDQSECVVSLETAIKLLGFTAITAEIKSTVSAVKTLAKNKLKLAVLVAANDAWEKAWNEVKSLPLPEIEKGSPVEPDSRFKNLVGRFEYHMGGCSVWSEKDGTLPENSRNCLIMDWRFAQMKARGFTGSLDRYSEKILTRKIVQQEKKLVSGK